MWPLSAGEQRGVRETFVDRLFEPSAWPPPAHPALTRAELAEWILAGGYPEVVTERLRGRQRRDWFTGYVADVVSREALRPMADVRLELELRLVLRLLCARIGQELVISKVAADAQLSRTTAANYVALLEALYLVDQLPAWATSPTTRPKRRPKIIARDTGLAADVIGAAGQPSCLSGVPR